MAHLLMKTAMAIGVLALPVTGHVKLFFSSPNKDLGSRPIRNANSETGDGRFSTSGPCGGDEAFGANGVTELQKGGTIIAKMNYNGGHDAATNGFSAAFACGKPSQALFKTKETGDARVYDLVAADCKTTGCNGATDEYPCSYPTTKADGLLMECKVPTVDPSTQAAWLSDDCTFTVLESPDVGNGRAWGGCLDLKMTAAAAAPAKVENIDSTGMYMIKMLKPLEDQTTDCCINEGEIEVSQDGPAASVSITGMQVVCKNSTTVNVPDVVKKAMTKDLTGNTFRTTLTIFGQEYSLTASNGEVQLQNVDLAKPFICDPTIESTGGGLSESAGRAIAGSVTVIFLAAALALHCMWVERRAKVPDVVGRAMDRMVSTQARTLALVGMIMLVVFCTCLATHGWVKTDECEMGLTEVDCGGTTGTLTGDMKDAADVMAGCGAMAFLGIFMTIIIAVMLGTGNDMGSPKKLTLVALSLCVLAFTFLTAAWVNYCVEDAGIDDWDKLGAEYGPSFGFTVVVWLFLLIYTMMWRCLSLATMRADLVSPRVTAVKSVGESFNNPPAFNGPDAAPDWIGASGNVKPQV